MTKKEQPRFHSSFKVWMRVAAFFVALIFLPETVLAKATYSPSWTPTASQADMQAYSQSTLESLHREITDMRSRSQSRLIRDIGISLGVSFAMAGLSTYAKPWFNTHFSGPGSKVLSLGPTARWAITGAVAGTAIHGLSTGKWFKGNWYLYTVGGAAAGAAVPTVAQAWNTPGSWLSPVRRATDSVSNKIRGVFTGKTLETPGWEFGAIPQLTFDDPGWMGNLGLNGVARGFANAGIVNLTANLFSLAGMPQKQTELFSSFTSGAILGAIGGLKHLTMGLTGYVVPAISGGLTSAASTYATQLATDSGIKSRTAAMFIGNLAGLATNTVVNGIAVNFSDTYITETGSISKQKPSATSTFTPFGYYAKYAWAANSNKLISGLVSNSLIEIITRNPKIIGLTAEDLQTLPYASAVGGVFGAGFNGSSSITQGIARGLLSGALTIGETKLEASILKHNFKMTPVMAAFLVDAGTAAVRGLAESTGIVTAEGKVYGPVSTTGSIFDSMISALSKDALNVASFGYLGREQSLLGEISYLHTLTETFGPRTPEILRQQMAKNSLSGAAIGDGSTINLTLRDNNVTTLTLVGSSANIIPFMETNPRKGTRYIDLLGNTWASNGNGTYSLVAEDKQDRGIGLFVGWSQLAHDIYQSGAVRNMEGTVGALLPRSAANFFGLPLVSFMADYKDKKGKTHTGRFSFYSASGSDYRDLNHQYVTLENIWGNTLMKEKGADFAQKLKEAQSSQATSQVTAPLLKAPALVPEPKPAPAAPTGPKENVASSSGQVQYFQQKQNSISGDPKAPRYGDYTSEVKYSSKEKNGVLETDTEIRDAAPFGEPQPGRAYAFKEGRVSAEPAPGTASTPAPAPAGAQPSEAAVSAPVTEPSPYTIKEPRIKDPAYTVEGPMRFAPKVDDDLIYYYEDKNAGKSSPIETISQNDLKDRDISITSIRKQLAPIAQTPEPKLTPAPASTQLSETAASAPKPFVSDGQFDNLPAGFDPLISAVPSPSPEPSPYTIKEPRIKDPTYTVEGPMREAPNDHLMRYYNSGEITITINPQRNFPYESARDYLTTPSKTAVQGLHAILSPLQVNVLEKALEESHAVRINDVMLAFIDPTIISDPTAPEGLFIKRGDAEHLQIYMNLPLPPLQDIKSSDIDRILNVYNYAAKAPLEYIKNNGEFMNFIYDEIEDDQARKEIINLVVNRERMTQPEQEASINFIADRLKLNQEEREEAIKDLKNDGSELEGRLLFSLLKKFEKFSPFIYPGGRPIPDELKKDLPYKLWKDFKDFYTNDDNIKLLNQGYKDIAKFPSSKPASAAPAVIQPSAASSEDVEYNPRSGHYEYRLPMGGSDYKSILEGNWPPIREALEKYIIGNDNAALLINIPFDQEAREESKKLLIDRGVKPNQIIIDTTPIVQRDPDNHQNNITINFIQKPQSPPR